MPRHKAVDMQHVYHADAYIVEFSDGCALRITEEEIRKRMVPRNTHQIMQFACHYRDYAENEKYGADWMEIYHAELGRITS